MDQTPEVKRYLEDALDKLSNPSTCQDALQMIDSFLGQLCILSNHINLQAAASTKTKSFISKTQKPILKVWKVPNDDDMVFGQFVALQDNFQYNITGHIIQLLSLQSNQESSQLAEDTLVLANNVLQGCLLLHPESRSLFKRKLNLNLLLQYLENYKKHSQELITTVIQTLVCILVRNVPSLRVFEELNGPELICKIFNNTQEKSLKHKSLEFLMFYLIPEVQSGSSSNSTESSRVSTTRSTLSEVNGQDYMSNSTSFGDMTPSNDGYLRKSMEEKLRLLSPYLENVDELLNQFMEIKPFGKLRNIDW